MAINLVLDGAPIAPTGQPQTGLRQVETTPEEVLSQVEELTDEEKQMVDNFAAKIDVSSTDIVLNYGASAQSKSAMVATRTLQNVKTKNTGEVSGLLIQMVTAMDVAETGGGRQGPLRDFLSKMRTAGKSFMVRQQDVEKTLNDIEKQLEGHELKLKADIKMLNDLWDENWETFKELTLYIKAAEIAIEKARTGKLVELQQQAEASGKPEDAMLADKFAKSINQFEKRLTDLRLTRTSCLQSAPQINMLAQNDEDLTMKLRSSIIITMPLWRKKIAMSIAMQNNLEAAKAANAVDDATNRMLREQAVQFHTGVVESAKAINRQIIETETIEFVNNEIVDAVTDYIAIEKEGAENRRKAANILAQSERKLVQGVMGAVAQSAQGSAMVTPAET